jgi:hypothetical protein
MFIFLLSPYEILYSFSECFVSYRLQTEMSGSFRTGVVYMHLRRIDNFDVQLRMPFVGKIVFIYYLFSVSKRVVQIVSAVVY